MRESTQWTAAGQLTTDGPPSGLWAGALNPLRSGPPASTACCSDSDLQGCFPQPITGRTTSSLLAVQLAWDPPHTLPAFSYPTLLIWSQCKLFPTNLICFTNTSCTRCPPTPGLWTCLSFPTGPAAAAADRDLTPRFWSFSGYHLAPYTLSFRRAFCHVNIICLFVCLFSKTNITFWPCI